MRVDLYGLLADVSLAPVLFWSAVENGCGLWMSPLGWPPPTPVNVLPFWSDTVSYLVVFEPVVMPPWLTYGAGAGCGVGSALFWPGASADLPWSLADGEEVDDANAVPPMIPLIGRARQIAASVVATGARRVLPVVLLVVRTRGLPS